MTALRYYGDLFLAHFSAPVFATPPDFSVTGRMAPLPPGNFPLHQRGCGPFLYPPSFLLVAAPLSLLSQKTAYLVWAWRNQLGRRRGGALGWDVPRAIVLSLLSPPNLYCIATGQTGALLAASQLLAFGLAERRPIVAGLSASLLIIKPQFMLLGHQNPLPGIRAISAPLPPSSLEFFSGACCPPYSLAPTSGHISCTLSLRSPAWSWTGPGPSPMKGS